jgi:hypothetical protein
MATCEEIPDLFWVLKSDLTSRYKVRRIGVFGSYARKEARQDSDVDILVDFHPGADLFDLVDLSLYLEEKIGKKVDLATPGALRQEMREHVLRDVVYL